MRRKRLYSGPLDHAGRHDAENALEEAKSDLHATRQLGAELRLTAKALTRAREENNFAPAMIAALRRKHS